MADIFPRLLNISDIVASNVLQWQELLPPISSIIETTKNESDDIKINAKRNTTDNGLAAKVTKTKQSFTDKVDFRRMSFGPGIVQIPENVQKYLSTVDKVRNGAGISVSIRRISSTRTQQIPIRRDISALTAFSLILGEEDERENIDMKLPNGEPIPLTVSPANKLDHKSENESKAVEKSISSNFNT